MARAAWKLTIRNGSEVSRMRFGDLDAAIEEMEERAGEIHAEGPMKPVSVLRDFSPADQVRARFEITGRGLLRPPAAGVDLKGDGSLVAFSGGIRRDEIRPVDGGTPFDVVRRVLGGEQK